MESKITVPFNVPPFIGIEEQYVLEAIRSHKISGDGEFTKLCSSWLENSMGVKKVLLTTSGTHALEMAAILSGIRPGEEVIMPSYTFVSTANAFVMRGAKIVFVDIRPDTMNIDEKLIEDAITNKTKGIVPVHYAGVGCDMDVIMDIAARNHLFVIEDAAQGVSSTYKGRPLGTIGDYGCYSFHETKNYSMGEGGALLIQNDENVELAEIIREKGTNRSKFFRGQIDKYTWIDYGSSYLPSELNAAYLYGELKDKEIIFNARMQIWEEYYKGLSLLETGGDILRPFIPPECEHNAHMFYIKVKNLQERTKLIAYLEKRGINTAFHYVPLHSSPAGRRFGRFHGEDRYTTKESERLLRLPIYYGMPMEKVSYVIEQITDFFESQKAK